MLRELFSSLDAGLAEGLIGEIQVHQSLNGSKRVASVNWTLYPDGDVGIGI